MTLEGLIHGRQVNAVLGWTSIAVMGMAAVESFLTDAYLWGSLALLFVVVSALPALLTGEPSSMAPWPLPFVATVAVGLRATGFYPDITGYVTISSFALLLVVELEVYTEVELSHRFAVIFAAMTTMALQAFWIIAQFYSDQWLGTTFLTSQTELQWDIVYVTVVGVTLGIVAEWYIERFEPVGSFKQPPTG